MVAWAMRSYARAREGAAPGRPCVVPSATVPEGRDGPVDAERPTAAAPEGSAVTGRAERSTERARPPPALLLMLLLLL